MPSIAKKDETTSISYESMIQALRAAKVQQTLGGVPRTPHAVSAAVQHLAQEGGAIIGKFYINCLAHPRAAASPPTQTTRATPSSRTVTNSHLRHRPGISGLLLHVGGDAHPRPLRRARLDRGPRQLVQVGGSVRRNEGQRDKGVALEVKNTNLAERMPEIMRLSMLAIADGAEK